MVITRDPRQCVSAGVVTESEVSVPSLAQLALMPLREFVRDIAVDIKDVSCYHSDLANGQILEVGFRILADAFSQSVKLLSEFIGRQKDIYLRGSGKDALDLHIRLECTLWQ